MSRPVFQNVRPYLPAIFAGALLRLFFLWQHPVFSGDGLIYGELAHNMLRFHVFGFSGEPPTPTLIRLPGYPAFVAACFALFGDRNYLAVIAVQAALDLVTCVLLARLAERLFGARVSRVVLWLAVLCPFTANYAAACVAETCTLFAMVLALSGLERWWRERSAMSALQIGVACALCAVLRPDGLLVAAAVLPAMCVAAWRGPAKGRVQVGLAGAIVALPLLLWGIRNARVMHVFQPLAPRYANDPGEPVGRGFARWYKAWAEDSISTLDVYWAYDGEVIEPKYLPPRAFTDDADRAATLDVIALYNADPRLTPEVDARFDALADRLYAAHPVQTRVVVPVLRTADMWLRPRTELLRLPVDWWAFRLHPWGSALAVLFALGNLWLLAMAARGAAAVRAKGLLWWTMLAMIVMRCALLLTIENSEPRYTLECFPILLLWAGLAIAKRNRNELAASDC